VRSNPTTISERYDKNAETLNHAKKVLRERCIFTVTINKIMKVHSFASIMRTEIYFSSSYNTKAIEYMNLRKNSKTVHPCKPVENFLEKTTIICSTHSSEAWQPTRCQRIRNITLIYITDILTFLSHFSYI